MAISCKRDSIFSILNIRRAAILATASLLCVAGASAQGIPLYSGGPAQTGVPDESHLASLVWSTMIALDQANKTNNYTVLRDLGTAEFRSNIGADALQRNFEPDRRNGLDLAWTIRVEPTYSKPPVVDDYGQLHVQGRFVLRPKIVYFNFVYGREAGQWRLKALKVSTTL